jgi:hypothetical protein
VWKDGVIAYYTEKDQSYDRVLDIFIAAREELIRQRLRKLNFGPAGSSATRQTEVAAVGN